MNSFCTERFWSCLNSLPAEVRELARKSYDLWSVNPRHPSLRFKQLRGNLWSVRIGQHYRALSEVDGSSVTWIWIGHHAEYDALIR